MVSPEQFYGTSTHPPVMPPGGGGANDTTTTAASNASSPPLNSSSQHQCQTSTTEVPTSVEPNANASATSGSSSGAGGHPPRNVTFQRQASTINRGVERARLGSSSAAAGSPTLAPTPFEQQQQQQLQPQPQQSASASASSEMRVTITKETEHAQRSNGLPPPAPNASSKLSASFAACDLPRPNKVPVREVKSALPSLAAQPYPYAPPLSPIAEPQSKRPKQSFGFASASASPATPDWLLVKVLVRIFVHCSASLHLVRRALCSARSLSFVPPESPRLLIRVEY